MRILQVGTIAALLAALTFSLGTGAIHAQDTASPVAAEDCTGVEDYLSAAQDIAESGLGSVYALLEGDITKLAPDELRAAAATVREGLADFEALTPPPAAAAFHEATRSALDLTAQLLETVAESGPLSAIPFLNRLQQAQTDLETTLGDVLVACNVSLDEFGTPTASPVASPAA